MLARAVPSLTPGSAFALRVCAPMVSIRCRAYWCAAPLRHRARAVAQPCALVGAPVRHLRNQARRGAQDVAGCQPSGDPVRL